MDWPSNTLVVKLYTYTHDFMKLFSIEQLDWILVELVPNWRSWRNVSFVTYEYLVQKLFLCCCWIPFVSICYIKYLCFLHTVARGRSLFGDPASEIQELTGVIKQDIAKVNSDIAFLQEVSLMA